MQLPHHYTCKMKHHFPYMIVLAPTWTERTPRKWLQFTWKRNDYNSHESEIFQPRIPSWHRECW